MKYYRYTPDSDSFGCFSPKTSKDRNSANALSDGQAFGNHWKPFAVTADSTMGSAADFPSLFGGVPVFSERALVALAPLLGKSIEALPIKHPAEEQYYAINVLSVIDALDHSKSDVVRFSNGKVMRVSRYVFDRSKLGDAQIFKIPETKVMDVFLSEAVREAAAKAGLEGLLYVPVGD